MRKVAVIGWGGFTGRYFQEFVAHNKLDLKYEFIGLGRHQHDPVGPFQGIVADLLDYDRLYAVLSRERPDYVLNLASNTIDVRDSTVMIRNLFRALKHSHTPTRVLHVGSAAEYGIPQLLPVTEDAPTNPITLYGSAKLQQTETTFRESKYYNVPAIVARTFNLIGGEQPDTLVVGSFVKQVRETPDGGEISVGNLGKIRDFLSIEDAVMAYWIILTSGKDGEIYNVCSGLPTRVGEVLEYLIARSKKRFRVIPREDRIRSNDVPEIYGDNSKLRDLGWSQVKDWRRSSEC